ncbi:MAG: radical SAM protein [Zoogloeaceae bacterium]|nr:radical SAM protein [Zoogloeaceae bacterium]
MKALSMPFQVGWDITHSCNFRCRHCLFSSEQLSDKTSLSRDEALSFISHLAEKKVFHLSLAGGEPLLYPYIVDVIAAATSAGILVAMSTNASLLDKALAEELKKAGLKSLQISLDGSNSLVNDSIRGEGSFDRTMSGIKTAISSGFSVYLAIVIVKQNIHELHEYMEFASNLGVHGIKVQTLIDSGLGHENIGYTGIEESALRLKLIELWNAKEKYRDKLEVMLPLIPEALEQAKSEPEYFNKNTSCLGCQPGLSTVRVNSHGDVRACGGQVNAPSIGNILEKPLQEIWKESSEIVRWRNASLVEDGVSNSSCGSICGNGCRSATVSNIKLQEVHS